MDDQEAFEFLGIAPSATDEEIEGKYRELVPQNHPDAEGSSSEMEKLNAAREKALESDNTIVKRESIEDSIQYSTRQEQRRIESEKTVDKIIDRGVKTSKI